MRLNKSALTFLLPFFVLSVFFDVPLASADNRSRTKQTANSKRKTASNNKHTTNSSNKGKKITPTFEEHLTPEQVDRKIATFRSRIVNAPKEKIHPEYKEALLNAFNNLAKYRIGRYVFEKAHPDLSFATKELKRFNGVYASGCVILDYKPNSKLNPTGIEYVLLHEITHSVHHVNKTFAGSGKSIKEKLTLSLLNELSATLTPTIAAQQRLQLQNKKDQSFFNQLYTAKIEMGADEKTAERFARTKYVEATWSNRHETIRVGNKNILPRYKPLTSWGGYYERRLLATKKRSMQDTGIDKSIREFIAFADIDTPVSFFRQPPFEVPDLNTIIWYRDGIKFGEIRALSSSSACMIKYFAENGDWNRLRFEAPEKKGKAGNRSYTEFHKGTQKKWLTYTYKNGSINGICREYDKNGQLIMQIPIKNNLPTGIGWILKDGKRIKKAFEKGSMRDISPRSTVVRTINSKCIAEIHYDKSGKVVKFNLQPTVPGKNVPNGPYIEYHEDNKTKRATYSFRKGKLNGFYREFDRYGRQTLGVTVRNGRPDGHAWFLEDGMQVLKSFRNNKMYDKTRIVMSKAVIEKHYDKKELKYVEIRPVEHREIPDMDVSDHSVSGDEKIRAKYSFKNRKVNGIYREFTPRGQQIMAIPIVNNRASGSGWYIDDRNIRLEATFKKGAIIEL